MKKSILFLSSLIFLVYASLSAQNNSALLDGKSYDIVTWDVNNANEKTPDKLIFKDGKVDSPACHEWGFSASSYTSKEKGEKVTFDFVMTSESEGKMTFSGTTEKKSIEGSFIWQKKGQSDIHYKFSGKIAEVE